MEASPSVLIIDDDPMHLRIYGWIIEAAGYRAVLAGVRLGIVNLPEDQIDLVLLDYHLDGNNSAVKVAELIHERFADVPILVLSDAFSMPEDIAPLVQGFLRKGNPAKLVGKLHEFLKLSL
jgi:CheY-like chemotaxis protein